MQTSVVLYPLTNYTFGTKEPLLDEDISNATKISKLQTDYATQGMRTTVEAVLIVHDHNHPHILMLQQGPSFFRLPSGPLIPGEEDVQGIKRILEKVLGPQQGGSVDDWDIGESIGVWWRPHFETFQYPYLPSHITRPKEMKKVILIHLPDTKVLTVPKNLKLVAVPLYELFDNAQRYGQQLAALTQMLSRFNFVYQ